DSIDRKCIIVTDYSEFRVSKNLNEIEGMVNANFIKTHRACLINKKRITSYNKPKRIVTFDNGTKTDLISTRFDKELI
ncbi:MAG: LytTR family transcriptional regulator DNA-binding domain-containing protein, partial [Bacilli bacterium]|nr:LytTR family transcriptional regulator DNA-binding domain-containing protein [Bacilli bacterium]